VKTLGAERASGNGKYKKPPAVGADGEFVKPNPRPKSKPKPKDGTEEDGPSYRDRAKERRKAGAYTRPLLSST